MRLAQAVDDPALEGAADRHAQRRAGGDDFAAGMDAVDFAQRHQQQMMIAEADHLGQRRAVMPGRLECGTLRPRRQRALRIR